MTITDPAMNISLRHGVEWAVVISRNTGRPVPRSLMARPRTPNINHRRLVGRRRGLNMKRLEIIAMPRAIQMLLTSTRVAGGSDTTKGATTLVSTLLIRTRTVISLRDWDGNTSGCFAAAILIDSGLTTFTGASRRL